MPPKMTSKLPAEAKIKQANTTSSSKSLRTQRGAHSSKSSTSTSSTISSTVSSQTTGSTSEPASRKKNKKRSKSRRQEPVQSTCHICNVTLPSRTQLFQHLEMECAPLIARSRCRVCKKRLSADASIDDHLKSHERGVESFGNRIEKSHIVEQLQISEPQTQNGTFGIRSSLSAMAAPLVPASESNLSADIAPFDHIGSDALDTNSKYLLQEQEENDLGLFHQSCLPGSEATQDTSILDQHANAILAYFWHGSSGHFSTKDTTSEYAETTRTSPHTSTNVSSSIPVSRSANVFRREADLKQIIWARNMKSPAQLITEAEDAEQKRAERN